MCVGNKSNPIDVDLNVLYADFDSLGLDRSICSCEYISLDDASQTRTSKGDLIVMQLNVLGLLSKQ